ncbi:MAG: potassium channel protein [Proteobacteria bacterium]|nr:potassium channel protein [Pseudomonadota bacterium]MBU1688977.1 potassium channel protein [Pseudomonadota bacterium]
MQILRHKLINAGAFLITMVMVGTFGYYILGTLEHQKPYWRLWDCFYMTIITLTTVGFGEVIDLANVPGSRLFTIFILVCGLGISAYFLSSLTAFLVEGELKNVFWRKNMKKKIEKLSGHIILCGAGRVGKNVLDELIKTGQHFVLVEQNESRVFDQQENHGDFPAIIGDATHDEFLLQAGVERASGVISTLGDDKDNLCVVVTCKGINPSLRIVTRCNSKDFSRKLSRLGAEVVIPNLIGGLRMASQMVRPRVVKYLDTMLRDTDKVVRIEEVTIPQESPLVGKTIADLDLSHNNQLLLLAVVGKMTNKPIYHPSADYLIIEGDTLVFQTEPDVARQFKERHHCQ